WAPLTGPVRRTVLRHRTLDYMAYLEVRDADGNVGRDTYPVHHYYVGMGPGGRVDPREPMENEQYMEDQRSSQLRVNQGVSTAYRATSEVEDREGMSGLPGARRNTRPTYDASGVNQLIDTESQQMASMQLAETVRVNDDRSVHLMFAKGVVGAPDNADAISAGPSQRVTTLDEATGGGRGYTGLASDGRVARVVPRGNAAGELPAISTGDGKLLASVAMSGSPTAFPVDSSDPVGALMNGASVELGSGKANTGLDASGKVQLGVPRGHAVSEIPAIASVDGRLLPTVLMSGSASAYPVDTSDGVAALSNGATVEQGAGRANTGLASTGKVQLGVPRGHAVFEITAIAAVDGRLLATVLMSGSTSAYPVDTADNVAALANGATVETGAGRANTGLDGLGKVQLGVPRGHAVFEIPAIATADGRLLATVLMSGSTSAYPIDTADSVAALLNGATVEQGAGRANTGLASTGKVQLGVPRGHAVFELPALSATDGRLLATILMSGSTTAYPVDTADGVAALVGGAAVETGAGKANTGLDGSGRVQLGISRGYVLVEVPALSSVNGRLIPTVAMSHSDAAYPIDTTDSVAALYNGATVEAGAGRANAGLDYLGTVQRGVPRGYALVEVPALSSVNGRLIATMGMSHSDAAYPVDSGDSVAALVGGAAVETGAGKANAGLDAYGTVQRGVPRGYALVEVPAISTVDGRLIATVYMSGTSAYPVDTSDGIAVLVGGATVESNSASGAEGRFRVDSLYAGEQQLRSTVTVKEGNTALNVARGIKRGTTVHNERVNFSTPFPSTPTIIFGMGGTTFHPDLAGVEHGPVVDALEPDPNGFTTRAILQAAVGTVSPKSATFSGEWATKVDTPWAWDGKYTFQFTVNVRAAKPINRYPTREIDQEEEWETSLPSGVTLYFYTDNGTGPSLRAVRDYSNDWS
ncbi:MAG TPA: hypothetical protein VF263_10260, partial [Longimicrobiaceae bacterium]